MKSLKLLALISIFSFISINTVFAVEASGFSATPTYPNLVNSSQFTYELQPGSTIQDSITVTNHDPKPAKLFIYAVDSVVNNQKLDYKLETNTQAEIGKWTTVSQKEIDIPANSSQDVPFTITIPQDAALQDYIGGISSEIRSDDPTPGSQLKINYRIVTRVNLKVTNTPQPVEKQPSKNPVTPTQAYLYISAALFVLVLAWFVAKSLQEKKKAKSSSTHTHHQEHKK